MAGPTMEEQLPGLMSGLEGQWGSRRRRMTLDDSELGDRLPKGWKLLLGLEGKVKYCRCYIREFSHVAADIEKESDIFCFIYPACTSQGHALVMGSRKFVTEVTNPEEGIQRKWSILVAKLL